MNERKRQRQAEIEQEEKLKLQKEWNKNFEVLRKHITASILILRIVMSFCILISRG